ncbi:MAG: hypothetical protein J0L96_03725 [Anaerolineae bacterium]|nr:hypothetical protein [Anaerolineae bacterium]
MGKIMVKKINNSDFSEEQIKHMELVKSDIQQLEAYSFQIKGWHSTFIAASMLSATQNKLFALLAIIPIITFWLMDTYYIQAARKYRGIYNDLTRGRFSTIEIKPFTFPVHNYIGERFSYINVLTSVSILPFYLPPLIIMLLIYFLV